jgi:hypothetical protein
MHCEAARLRGRGARAIVQIAFREVVRKRERVDEGSYDWGKCD